MFNDIPLDTHPFVFSIDGFDIGTFLVKDYHANEQVGGLYSYTVTLHSISADITSDAIINKRANLYIQRGEYYIPVSGVVSSFSYRSKLEFYSIFQITLVPLLWRLTLTRQSRVFQKKNDIAIIRDILNERGLKGGYTIDTEGTFEDKEYVAQYEESDYNFFCRLLARNGLWFTFREAEPSRAIPGTIQEETVVISNKPSSFIPVPVVAEVKFKTASELVQMIDRKMYENFYQFESHRQLVPKQVITKTSNYRTPEVDITGSGNVKDGDYGHVYLYGNSAKNVTSAQQYAKILAKREFSRQRTFTGKSNCTGIRAGYRVDLKEHVRSSLNQQYVLTHINHEGEVVTQESTITKTIYKNTFTAFASKDIQFYNPDITFNKVVMPDYMSTRIEGSGSGYATIDDTGRYKVRMTFDLSSSENCNASKYIRHVQYYSGADYGMHFPSHEGAEMVISHINGDPDKPIGIRVVPDGNTISPVKSSNHCESVIRTAGGNEIIMDDTDGKQRMCLNTPYDMNWNAGNNQSESITNDRSVTVGGDETRSVTTDQKLAVNGDRNAEISGNEKISVNGSDKVDITGSALITISGNSKLTADGENGEKYGATRSLSVSGDNQVKTSANHVVGVDGIGTLNVSGNITIEAGSDFGMQAKAMCTIMGTKVTIEGSSDLGVQAGAASVVITGEGVNLGAPLITITAGIIKSAAKTNNNITGLAVMLN